MNNRMPGLLTRVRLIQTWLQETYRRIFPYKRPRRMYRRDRPAVDEFRPTEQLYRRYRREELVKGMIVAAALQFPQSGAASGQSVNRSRFSRAKDALWFPEEDTRYEGWGVFQFP